MKRMKYLYGTLPVLFAVLCLAGCKWDPNEHDTAKIEEKLELTASADKIVLDENDLQKDIITFDWTEARQLPDVYIVSCQTKLDVLGNNFGTTTAIFNEEDEGVLSRSFTSEQINNWANEKWKIPVNTPFTLQFRVTVQWSGGPDFQPPEVRTVTVDVEPLHVFTFDADHVYVDGSAVGSQTEIFKTLENENQYAWVGNLSAGELTIPVDFKGEITYICPADLEGTLEDGVAENVTMLGGPVSWDIVTPGQYRIVIDMEKTTITIYSATTDLQPKEVETSRTDATLIPVAKFWLHGSKNNWGTAVPIDFTVSLADPQVLVYSGSPLTNWTRAKFIVTNVSPNDATAFTPPLTGSGAQQDITLVSGKASELHSGSDTNTRNSYFRIPENTNYIVIDVRNMTILTDIR